MDMETSIILLEPNCPQFLPKNSIKQPQKKPFAKPETPVVWFVKLPPVKLSIDTCGGPFFYTNPTSGRGLAASRAWSKLPTPSCQP